MFKKALVLTLVFVSLSCIGTENSKAVVLKNNFEVLSKGELDVGKKFDDIYIIKDKETKMEYIVIEGKYEFTITPRLGKVGK